MNTVEYPSVEQFRRLAQSSPWRWTTVEFDCVSEYRTPSVHALIRRPGAMRIENAVGEVVETHRAGVPFGGLMVQYSDGTSKPADGRWPTELTPTFDEDGLVSEIPMGDNASFIDFDDPMYLNYQWVAMLDPIELARSPHDHTATDPVVELSELSAVVHHGRPAWQATARPTVNYDARCECCSLLSGAYDFETQLWVPGPPLVVRLDTQTGICVSLRSTETGVHDDYLDVAVNAVDAEMDDSLFAPKGR